MSRLCALLLVWGVALWPGPPREIAGRVVDGQTGAPIPHARVRITSSGSQSDEIVVLTGDDGGFHLTSVPEGRYQLSCERAGYLRGFQNVESQPVQSASDAKPVSLSIRLTPQAVIEGAVVDESGGAVPFANIQVYRRVAIEGRRQAQFVSQVQADDKGSFRIFDLTAGGYCIGVTVSPAGMRRPKLAYPPVFYPNAPSIANAQFVDLRPGEEQQIRIRLPEPVPAREIQGQIVPAVEGVSAQLRPADSAALGLPSGFELHWDQKTHSFRFTGVTPGVYVIDVTAQLDGQQKRATTIVTVAGQDVTGIRLELSNQTTLSGTVRVEGKAAPVHLVASVALHSSSYQFGTVVQADGSFEFRNLPPDTYHVALPQGGTSYLRSAWYGGRDALHDGLTISGEAPPAPLEITLGSPGGTVEGTVALRDTEQADTMVVALLRRAGNAMVLEKQVSVSGSLPAGAVFSINNRPPVYGGRPFTLQGVAPGDYLLFTWAADAQVEYADPEFARQHEDLGKPVTVAEGAKVTVNIDRALLLNQP
jgi:hypothetical protein